MSLLWYRRNERSCVPLKSLVSEDDCIMGGLWWQSQTVQEKLLQHASLVINHKTTAHQTELRLNKQNLVHSTGDRLSASRQLVPLKLTVASTVLYRQYRQIILYRWLTTVGTAASNAY
ncbi:hypothetical protein PROFUN_03715 [Planoprotostelium fungivorum]|uniref:Uncharacterized protein n=1 Tax=Planoprotostelium fungivorum TaxID=1890364 RepID=A0A2P6NDL9_9EUKA|nr:hypothetical protein PROFUN_03715 [Planoprotostelium fungivorum]